MQGGFSANRAIGAIGAGRNGALDQRDILARIVANRLRQRVFGLAASRSHDRFMVVERNRIQDEIGNCRMAGPQERFGVAGTILEFKPDQDRSRLVFNGLGNHAARCLREPQDCRHRGAKS